MLTRQRPLKSSRLPPKRDHYSVQTSWQNYTLIVTISYAEIVFLASLEKTVQFKLITGKTPVLL